MASALWCWGVAIGEPAIAILCVIINLFCIIWMNVIPSNCQLAMGGGGREGGRGGIKENAWRGSEQQER